MTRTEKPKIPDDLLKKWQRIVDLMGCVTQTPAALITRVTDEHVEMFICHSHINNPFSSNEKSPRNCGLYCDHVINNNTALSVNDAHADPVWDNNPDLKHNLSFYLGYPLFWPDGEPFGTICVLDQTTNTQALSHRQLIEEFQSLVNADLAVLLELQQQQQQQLALEASIQQKNLQLRSSLEDLAEVNTALRVVLKQREEAHQEITKQAQNDVLQQIIPWLQKLETSHLNKEQLNYLTMINKYLTRGVSEPINLIIASLTATELKVFMAIKQGLSSKKIAQQLFLEKSTVDFHRKNIRVKLGLKNDSTTLRSYIQRLTPHK